MVFLDRMEKVMKACLSFGMGVSEMNGLWSVELVQHCLVKFLMCDEGE